MIMNEQALQSVADKVVKQIRASQKVTLDTALLLAEKIKQKAVDMGVRAVVAVSDNAGHPVLAECMDDSYIASYDIAVNKAFTAVSLKMSTASLKPMAQPGGSLYGIQFTNQGKIVIFGGGEPLKNSTGKIIGGLGVSGGSEEQDTALAAYGKEIFEKGKYL